MDDAAADRICDGLRAVVRAQFFHNLYVNLHVAFGNKEAFGDIAVTITLGDLLQNPF